MTNTPGDPPPTPSWPEPPALAESPPPLPGTVVPGGAPTRPRRQRTAAKVWAIVLGVLLVLALGAVAVLLTLLLQTSATLDDTTLELERTNDELDDRERLLDEQRLQLDEKETFGQSMGALMDTAQQFDGAPAATLVDFQRFADLARSAWEDRHDVDAVGRYTEEVLASQQELTETLAAAAARAGNVSGSTAESLIDALGLGFVETVWGDASAVCETEALGCVWGGEPLVIHLDADGFAEPYRTEWGEQLVAYHEFAHVLQFTNPLQTVDPLAAFGGDSETMADCYALTMLDAWTLSERVWTSGSSYWDVSYGYGVVCDDSQRQIILDWVDSSGVHYRPIGQ